MWVLGLVSCSLVQLHSSGTRENGVGDTHNLEGVCDDAHSHELLSVVAAVHHERVGETLNDGALCLAETLHSVSASRVGNVHGLSDLDVIAVVSQSVSIRSFLCPTSPLAATVVVCCNHARRPSPWNTSVVGEQRT